MVSRFAEKQQKPARKQIAASGQSIAAVVQSRLHDSPYMRLRDVKCDYREGVLTLRGRLPSYYLKQVALSLAQQIDGVEVVVDHLDVAAPQHDGA